MRRLIPLIIILSITSAHTPLEAYAISVPEKIKVVVTEAKELKLSVRGKYKIVTVETSKVLKEGDTFFNKKITRIRNGIRLGNNSFKIHAIHIVPENEPSIYLGKRLYRGSLQIIRTKEGLLRAINIVGLEDYLRGVLYHEVSHRWPIDTIKAQAIVSRTYALYKAGENINKDYFLKADTSSQVYGGAYAEKYRTDKAIDETRGQVLMYKGKILPAFFHSTCGGKTEAVHRLWKLKTKPLKGVNSPYCVNGPYYSWEDSISLPEIEKKLGTTKYKITGLYSIKIKGRNGSGRITNLLLIGRRKKVKISAKDFRHILGSVLIKSTNFEISIKDNKVYFTGKGWGHGVGMCQWGAFAMAKKRFSVKDILKHFYPGVKIVKLDHTK
ncbi:SpoIID/LytB domain-containing protein [Candidatus Omnitrophota bacterium]